jgi:hypothetical protein
MGGLYPSDDCEVSLGETPFSGHLFRRPPQELSPR